MAKIQVRARAVDLLGRQQVAGIPTAISELFKNAHDAYARRVEVDFYRRRELLILRDDGLGMSRADFEQRWLTLGTESKAAGAGLEPPPIDPDQPLRPVMGEKGIGRLSIALIGPQVLILTRPKQTAGAGVTAAFVNWSVFGLTGVDLSAIEIPILELPAGRLPNAHDVSGLLEIVRTNLSVLTATNPETRRRLTAELDRFDLDPDAITTRLPDGPDLRTGSGTQFWICPTNEVLIDDIDGPPDSERASSLEKVLLGFSNTMTPGHSRPPIEARFRDHLADGLQEERIAESNFFTPEEFEGADHHVSGLFDARGQFSGTISVYGESPVPYTVRWANPGGQDTACGPFNINFAYVQGAYRDSRLPREEWGALTAKLNRIGGLYIYRDGIRILPYGDSDYDFLNIENRRTRKADYYFFSYRRIFGVVDVSRQENANLVEKAGREGFQENKAYRQFKGILENFFVQTAADFFRDEGTYSNAFVEEKIRLNRERELLEQRRRQVGVRRRELHGALAAFFEAIAERNFETSVEAAIAALETACTTASEQGFSLEQLTAAMRSSRVEIETLDRGATIVRPRGVGLTRDLSRLWSRYEVERRRLQVEVFEPAHARLESLTAETASRLDLTLDVRSMVAEVLEDLGERHRRRARALQTEVQRNLSHLRERALLVARTGFQAVDASVKTTLITFEHVDAVDLSKDNLRHTRERLERQIEETAQVQTELLERLRDQLKVAATPAALQGEEMLEALEGELEERRERDLESLQLAQMGMAIGIVHHEFHAVIRNVRRNVRRLKSWADRNSTLKSLYDDISRSYSHLDGYLSLFAPLNRRLSQSRTLITGENIHLYLAQLLGERMARHGIELVATDAFKSVEVSEYVSTLYPPFVNLLDNSLHWLTSGEGVVRDGQGSKVKRVTLDFQEKAFLISDNGPGVLPGDYDAIFESGFSRKPNGSGLGLYITRSLLAQAGYELTLDPYEQGQGATFRIHLPPDLVVGSSP